MPQIVPAAERVLQVFEAFAREARPLSNSELARFLGVADSSCSDLLHTLRSAGYLVRSPRSRLFHPTTKLLDISRDIARSDPLQVFASEVLETLGRETGESALCGYLDGTNVRIVACYESPRALRYVLRPGARVDVNVSALGKALLAVLDEPAREALLVALPMTAVTASSITSRDTLRREILACGPQGVHSAVDEGSDGVTALAVAGTIGDRPAAISVVGPTARVMANREANANALLAIRREFL